MTNNTEKEKIAQSFAKFLDDNDIRGGLAYFAMKNTNNVAIAMQNVSDAEILDLVANLVGCIAIKKGVSAKSIYDELTITTPDATMRTDNGMN